MTPARLSRRPIDALSMNRTPSSHSRAASAASTLRLFLVCVAIWGSTWIAITFQLGTVAPEASVCYRYLLAALVTFVYCRARGLELRFGVRAHAWFALFGALMFSGQYLFVYHAEQLVVSGLVAIGYSASPLLGMIGMRLCFATPMTPRVLVGSLLGIVGIVLVFLPEFARQEGGEQRMLGAAFVAAAVLIAACAGLVAHRNQRAKLPLWQTMAWAMLYGALLSLAVTRVEGKPFGFETSAAYVSSLLYLAVLGSVVTFAAYLTLIERIGPARAGYVGVTVPIVALLLSASFEGFRWQTLTYVGIAVSLIGNVVMLREQKTR
jgi:drug/metabolite transporter (DMT)-like permease